MKKRIILLLGLFFVAGFATVFLNKLEGKQKQKSEAEQTKTFVEVCKKQYGISFPPFSNKKQIDFSVKELAELGVDKVRLAIDWSNREPEKGSYNWKPMDLRMDLAKENGLKVLLTVPNNGPDWACSKVKDEKGCVFKNKEDFQLFVREILKRYQLDKIQFGNEWDNAFIGSAEEFVEYNNLLYEITKEVSPKTKVVLGGITRAYPIQEIYCNRGVKLDFSGIEFKNGYTAEKILAKLKRDYCDSDVKERVLYALENAKYDILDIHLYDDPANWQDYLELLPKEKPIIVTEFGGPSSVFEKTNQDYQAGRIQEYLETIESLPIEEAYYFKLVDSKTSFHKETGLFDGKLKQKKAYGIFKSCVSSSLSSEGS